MTESTDHAEERIRDAVTLAGGSMRVTVSALMRNFGPDATPEIAEGRLLDAGITPEQSLPGLGPDDYVVLHAQSDSTAVILAPPGEEEPVDAEVYEEQEPVSSVGRPLTMLAGAGKLAMPVGREREIDQVIELLSRRRRRGVMLVGPPGIGKTAIVEGVAQRFAAGDCPPELAGLDVQEVLPTALLSFFPDPESLADVTRALLNPAIEDGRILFIQDFQIAHTYGGPGRGLIGGIRNALRDGSLGCIGSISNAHWAAAVQADPGIERLLEPIRIREVSAEEAVAILAAARGRLGEAGAEDEPPEELLRHVVSLAVKRLPNRRLPEKALDLLDRVMTRARTSGASPTPEMVDAVVAELTGVPLEASGDRPDQLVANLGERLRAEVIGQEEAVEAVVSKLALKLRGFDLRPQRPNGVFLFTGPTGVGKTQLAKALATHLLGSEDRILRLDMSEHSESHHVSQIIGAPPGYVGFEQGSPLLDRIEAEPFTLVLLDEVEKAHPAIHRLFLQVFDDGVITTSAGRRVHFSDAVIVMTSNVDVARRPPGFASDEDPLAELGNLTEHFPREFINRVDAVCHFRHLEAEDIRRIVGEVMVPKWLRGREKDGLRLRVSDAALDLLATHGCSRELGARELERVVEYELLAPVLDAFEGPDGLPLVAEVEGGKVIVRTENES